LKTPERRQITSWEEAEVNARDWMRTWGFRDAELTPPGADSGVDVRSRDAIAQVKYEARDVGRPYLQMLVGARGKHTDTGLLFFTGSRYTGQAVNYAEEMGIALFHYKLDGSIEAINKSAESLMKAKDRPSPGGEKAKPPQRRVTHPYVHALGSWLFALSLLVFLIQLFTHSHEPGLLSTALAGSLFGIAVAHVLRARTRDTDIWTRKQHPNPLRVPPASGRRDRPARSPRSARS
jgi:hypothetical protein